MIWDNMMGWVDVMELIDLQRMVIDLCFGQQPDHDCSRPRDVSQPLKPRNVSVDHMKDLTRPWHAFSHHTIDLRQSHWPWPSMAQSRDKAGHSRPRKTQNPTTDSTQCPARPYPTDQSAERWTAMLAANARIGHHRSYGASVCCIRCNSYATDPSARHRFMQTQ
jgi:hypothetical protein